MATIDDLTDWLCYAALPLWARVGWDRSQGTFVEQLDAGGAPLYEVPRRVMVQARQIVVFCLAYENGWWPEGADLALRAGLSLIKNFRSDRRPGWAFSTDRFDTIIDARRDLYAQAFVLLAFAALARIDGRRWKHLAEETLEFLDTFMATPEVGGYRESEPPCVRPRRQNPHMHLFEAMLALHEAGLQENCLRRAEKILVLLQRRFLRGRRPVLVESFTESWAPLEGAITVFEPGHHFEWVWLLRRYARLRGEPPIYLANQMWKVAADIGLAPGWQIYQRVRADGVIVDGSYRLWSSTEAAKAAAGDRSTVHLVEPFLEALRSTFLRPATYGSWVDHVDARGRRLTPYAPASSLYHICCAVHEIEKMRAEVGSAEWLSVSFAHAGERTMRG